MNKLYGIVGLVSILFGVFFIIFFITTPDKSDGGIVGGVLLMLLIFWGAGIPCLLYFKNHKVSFNEDSILVVNVFGKQKKVEWAKIADINFKALWGLIVIDSEGEKVKIHQHMVGISKFIETLERNTHWTNNDLRVPLRK